MNSETIILNKDIITKIIFDIGSSINVEQLFNLFITILVIVLNILGFLVFLYIIINVKNAMVKNEYNENLKTKEKISVEIINDQHQIEKNETYRFVRDLKHDIKNNKTRHANIPKSIIIGDFKYYYNKNKGTYLVNCTRKIQNNDDVYKPEQPLDYLYGVKITDYSNIFCFSRFKKIDLTDWNMSNVERIDKMFDGCECLEELYIHTWDVSNIKSMHRTFTNCKQLKTLETNNFNFNKLESAKYAFSGCLKLTELNTLNWNMTELRYADGMFLYCKNINKLELKYWNVTKIETAMQMFFECRSITELDLSGWNLDKFRDATFMFHNASKLETINRASITITHYSTESDSKSAGIFRGCKMIEKIEIIERIPCRF